ncbi:MAG: AAA family ATPase, partial [Candidatus Thermoplasmatota archaeon]|nr:AAA family ATPase [Candidatus Thermoplasmatota archaeon]
MLYNVIIMKLLNSEKNLEYEKELISMLDRIRVKNFKAHVDTEIDLKPITIFIGPNNSGKSTLFQLILLFKQCLNRNVQSLNLYPYGFDRYADKTQENFHGINFQEDILIDLGDDRLGLLNDILKPLMIEMEGHSRLKEEKIRKIGNEFGKVKLSLVLDDEFTLTGAK